MTDITPPTTPSSRWAAISPVLDIRNFRLFWFSQIVSTTGTFFQLLAERWLIFEMTGSTLLLGVVGFISLVPVIPISFLGGFIIDRVPRRKLILVTQSGLLLQAVLFALLVASGQLRVWHIFVLDFVLGVLSAVDQPARQAFLTDLVGKEELSRAIALNAILFHFTRLIGFTSSGLLIALIGASGTMILNALTYLAPIVALLLITVDGMRHERETVPLKSALWEGLRTLWQRPAVLGIISLLAVVGGLTWPVYGLMPAFVETVLLADSIALGGLMGVSGLGALIGIALIPWLGKKLCRGQQLLIASLITPLFMLSFGASSSLFTAGLFSLLLGFSQLILQTMSNTLVQVNVPDRVRGRVMSIYTLLNAGAPASANVVIGAITGWIGLPLALVLSGAIAGIYALVLAVKTTSIRRLA